MTVLGRDLLSINHRHEPMLSLDVDSTTALEALEKGFNDLMDLCDVVTEKFTVARDQFNEDASNQMQA